MSILDTAQALVRVMGLNENMISFITDRPGQDRRYAIDHSKIESELGWKPQFSFDQGLREMVEWYRKNEAWWRPIKDSSGYRRWYKDQFEE